MHRSLPSCSTSTAARRVRSTQNRAETTFGHHRGLAFIARFFGLISHCLLRAVTRPATKLAIREFAVSLCASLGLHNSRDIL